MQSHTRKKGRPTRTDILVTKTGGRDRGTGEKVAGARRGWKQEKNGKINQCKFIMAVVSKSYKA